MRFSVAFVTALSAFSASASIMKRGAPEILSSISAISSSMSTLQSAADGFPKTATYAQVDSSADLVMNKLNALLSAVTASDKVSAADSGKIAAAFSAQIPAIKKTVETIVAKKGQIAQPAQAAHVKEELHHFQGEIRKTQGALAGKLTLDGAAATNALDIFKQIDGVFTSALTAFA